MSSLACKKIEHLPPISCKFPANYRRCKTLSIGTDLFKDTTELEWVPPRQWDDTMKRNKMCEFCGNLLSYLTGIDACCCYCNVVAHMQCINPLERTAAYEEQWICPECAFDMNESRIRFNRKRNGVILDRTQNLAITLISKTWRGYLTRKRYLLFVKAIYRLQCIARIIYRQHVFKEIRKLMLRPLKLHILHCSPIDLTSHENFTPVLTVAVIDQHKRDKVAWYFEIECTGDKSNPRFDERVLLPGVSAIHTIVLTVMLRGPKRSIFLGQGYVCLGDNNYWRIGGHMSLQLDTPEFVLKEFGTLSEHEVPPGHIEFDLEPLSGLRSECGCMFGPNLDSYLRIAYFAKRMNNGLKIVKAFSKTKGATSNASDGNDMMSLSSQSRLWVCIADGHLYLYTRAGAALRGIIDLKYAHLSFVLDKNGTSDRMALSIKLAGLPPMVLSVGDPIESWRWKFAIISSYKFARDPTQHFDLYDHRSDIDKLYNDLSSSALRTYNQAKQIFAPANNTGTLSPSSTSPLPPLSISAPNSVPVSSRVSSPPLSPLRTSGSSDDGKKKRFGFEIADTRDAPTRLISPTSGANPICNTPGSGGKRNNVWSKVLKDNAAINGPKSSEGLKVLGTSRAKLTKNPSYLGSRSCKNLVEEKETLLGSQSNEHSGTPQDSALTPRR